MICSLVKISGNVIHLLKTLNTLPYILGYNIKHVEWSTCWHWVQFSVFSCQFSVFSFSSAFVSCVLDIIRMALGCFGHAFLFQNGTFTTRQFVWYANKKIAVMSHLHFKAATTAWKYTHNNTQYICVPYMYHNIMWKCETSVWKLTQSHAKFSCRYAAQLRFSTCVPRQLTPQISITLHMAYI